MGTPRIGIDLMGSDISPVLLATSLQDLGAQIKQNAELVIFGTKETLPQGMRAVVAEEIITMEDAPLAAIRKKKKSSLCLGMKSLQKGEIDAFVSAGNTGALLAAATLWLPLLPGIERPALLALLPTKNRPMAVIDVGANVNFKIDHLLQFASMGIAFQKTRGILEPTVGLLNIGSEARKGSLELQQVHQKLQHLHKKGAIFLGNVEGKDVFQGHIDVLVTDGFTGNIFLKTAEGIAAFLLEELHQKVAEEAPVKIQEMLSTWHHRLHYAEYPGAILCGLDKIIVKCHGNSTPQTLAAAVKGVLSLVKHSFLKEMKNQLA